MGRNTFPAVGNSQSDLALAGILSAAGFLGVFGKGRYKVFYASGTFTVPPGVSALRVRVLGAGGGGCSLSSGSGSSGGDGGSSSFGSLLSATGGKGGKGSSGLGATSAGGAGIGGDFQAAGGESASRPEASGGGAAGSQLGNGGAGGQGGGGGVGGGNGGTAGGSAFGSSFTGVPGPNYMGTFTNPPDLFQRRFPLEFFLGAGGTSNVAGGSGAGGGPGAQGGEGGGGGATNSNTGVGGFGAGGGGRNSGSGYYAAGGGGGGYAHGVVAVDPGASFAVTVGIPGSQGQGINGVGAAGGPGLVIVEW